MQNEKEGKALMLNFLKQLGFTDVDVVFIQQIGPGARIRGRACVHRPADKYRWLIDSKEEQACE